MRVGQFKVSDLLIQCLATHDRKVSDLGRELSQKLDDLLFQMYWGFRSLPDLVDVEYRASVLRSWDERATRESDRKFWIKVDRLASEVGRDETLMCFRVPPEETGQAEIPVVYVGPQECFVFPAIYKPGRYFVAYRGLNDTFEVSCPLRLHAVLPVPLHYAVEQPR